jgi:hypothetical protein
LKAFIYDLMKTQPRRHPGFAAGKDRDPGAASRYGAFPGPGHLLRKFRDDGNINQTETRSS